MTMQRFNPDYGMRMERVLVVIAITIGILAFASLDASPAELSGQASVIDASTLIVDGQQIRLRGIDAIGRHKLCMADGIEYICGLHAIFDLTNFLDRGRIVCQTLDAKREEVVLAVCRMNGQDVGAWLVQEGWAVPRGEGSSEYVVLEEDAKRNKRGIWAGSF